MKNSFEILCFFKYKIYFNNIINKNDLLQLFIQIHYGWRFK